VEAAAGSVNASQVNILNGSVLVDGRLDPASINISAGGTLSGAGTIIGDVSNAGNLILGDTAINPGRLSEIGNYFQGTGALVEGIESATHYGTFNVSGNLTLGGTLDINLLNGFDPTSGEIFDLMNYSGTESGEFAPVAGWTVLYDLNGNQQIDLEYKPVSESTNSALLSILGMTAIMAQRSIRKKRGSYSALFMS
jgi:hypothetical protein